jgi:hypothetical protein
MLRTANLGWLEGFPLPDGVRWIVVPAHAPMQEIRLEGRHLSRATYTLNKLRGEMRAALPRLVPDPDAWLAAAEHRVERLKPAVHQGTPPPAILDDPALSRAQRERLHELLRAEPQLEILLSALSWMHAGDPSWTRDHLDVVRDWSPGLGVLTRRLGEMPALLTMLRLLQLVADHGRSRVEALASCLFDGRVHDVALDQGENFCQQILGALGKREALPLPEEVPAGSLGRELARWCEELVQQNHRAQRQCLRLFETVTPLPLVERWADWWSGSRKLLAEARDLKAQRSDRKSRREPRERLESHRQSAPPVLVSKDLLDALRQAADPAFSRTAPLLRALALIPGAAAPDRPRLFTYWSFLGGEGTGIPEARIATLLAGCERYLERASLPAPALLLPWSQVSGYHWDYNVDTEILETARPRSQVVAAYELLAAVATHYGGLERRVAINAVELFFLVGEPDLTFRLFQSLHEAGHQERHFASSTLRTAIRLCRERPESFSGVLMALALQEEGPALPPSEWPESVLAPLSSGELGEMTRNLIVSRQVDRLLVCATKSMLLAAAGIEPPLPAAGEPAAPGWTGRYPAELHPAICRLAALLQEETEAKVARWLAEDFPDPERLRREIGTLETRLQEVDEAGAPPLRKRLDALKERLARPAAPGPVRLQRLRGKLERAWGRAVLDRWEAALDERLPEALRKLLGIEEVPGWLSDPLSLTLLAAATRLRGSHRALAYRLFRLRCGPPPWDLRDAPENRAFVAERPEIDWRPWIDGVGTVTVQAANGRQLHLALEDDPLEVFRMGAHFQTCLSPGSMNYFSVFANAADVNKRVLYARDAAGKVVGRCLLALTAQAQLLVFEAYCHDSQAGFPQVCTDFAWDLARRMGTRVVPHGTVPALVASDWYDDGPRGLNDRFRWLEEGSPLRRRLLDLRPGELLDELRRELKPDRLNEATLPLLLNLRELTQRPELAVPLLRPLAECWPLPDDALERASYLALQAGATDLVRRLFLQPLTALLRRDYRWYAAEVLLALDPAGLLAALRQTRERGVRGWHDEDNGYRLQHAAEALEALYRPGQARAIWKLLADGDHLNASREMRARAREILEGGGQPLRG